MGNKEGGVRDKNVVIDASMVTEQIKDYSSQEMKIALKKIW